MIARVRLLHASQQPLRGERGIVITNLNPNGLSFATTDKFRADDAVEIELRVGEKTLIVQGLVRHVGSSAAGYGINTVGVKFVTTPSTRDALRELATSIQTESNLT